MPKENIFDLSKLIASKSNDLEVTTPISDFNDKMLSGYTLVEPDEWEKLPYACHIRYLRTDGVFRKGGYVKSVTHTKDLNEVDTIRIDLVANFTPNAIAWSLYKGSVDKIWKRIEPNTMLSTTTNINTNTNKDDVITLKKEIEFMKKEIEFIKKELQKMNNDSISVLQLVKSLHDI